MMIGPVGSTVSPGSLAFIAEVVVPAGGQASIDFSGISQAYRSLVVQFAVRGTQAAAAVGGYLQFNGDASASYDCERMYTAGATVSADNFLGQTSMQNIIEVLGATAAANRFASGTILVVQYANTNFHKGVVADTSSPDTTVRRLANTGVWKSTAAVNRLTLTLSAGNFAQFSSAALYGVL